MESRKTRSATRLLSNPTFFYLEDKPISRKRKHQDGSSASNKKTKVLKSTEVIAGLINKPMLSEMLYQGCAGHLSGLILALPDRGLSLLQPLCFGKNRFFWYLASCAKLPDVINQLPEAFQKKLFSKLINKPDEDIDDDGVIILINALEVLLHRFPDLHARFAEHLRSAICDRMDERDNLWRLKNQTLEKAGISLNSTAIDIEKSKHIIIKILDIRPDRKYELDFRILACLAPLILHFDKEFQRYVISTLCERYNNLNRKSIGLICFGNLAQVIQNLQDEEIAEKIISYFIQHVNNFNRGILALSLEAEMTQYYRPLGHWRILLENRPILTEKLVTAIADEIFRNPNCNPYLMQFLLDWKPLIQQMPEKTLETILIDKLISQFQGLSNNWINNGFFRSTEALLPLLSLVTHLPRPMTKIINYFLEQMKNPRHKTHIIHAMKVLKECRFAILALPDKGLVVFEEIMKTFQRLFDDEDYLNDQNIYFDLLEDISMMPEMLEEHRQFIPSMMKNMIFIYNYGLIFPHEQIKIIYTFYALRNFINADELTQEDVTEIHSLLEASLSNEALSKYDPIAFDLAFLLKDKMDFNQVIKNYIEHHNNLNHSYTMKEPIAKSLVKFAAKWPDNHPDQILFLTSLRSYLEFPTPLGEKFNFDLISELGDFYTTLTRRAVLQENLEEFGITKIVEDYIETKFVR